MRVKHGDVGALLLNLVNQVQNIMCVAPKPVEAG